MARQLGFTLLELLVALVVLSFLILGLTQALHLQLRAFESQSRIISRREDLDAVDRTLRHLVQVMEPGASGVIQGSASTLAFSSELPASASALPNCRAEVAIGVDAAHRLVLRFVPQPGAAALGLTPAVHELELLRGVDRLELAYWDPVSGDWEGRWNQLAPPALVRIRLIFGKEDRRRWPDIVEAPMLDPTAD